MNIIDAILKSLGYVKKPKAKAKRECAICGGQIKRGHRWHMEGGPRHWDCDHPTADPKRPLPSVFEDRKL